MSKRNNSPVSPEMPVFATQIAQCEERRPDPVFVERNQLRNEAVRALRRLIAHEASMDHSSYTLAKAAKALAELD